MTSLLLFLMLGMGQVHGYWCGGPNLNELNAGVTRYGPMPKHLYDKHGACAEPYQPPIETKFWKAYDHAVRSAAVRRQFQRLHPCPSTQKRCGSCPGYVVDHVIPLACGGADSVLNLQWQTVKAAKLKDKWERKGCPKEQNLECDTNRTKDGHCK